MGRTVALVVAAGSGSRAGGALPKQYRRIAGKALLAHAVDHLRHPKVDTVQVVIGQGQEADYLEAIGERPLPAPIIGGATRRLSVLSGLDALARAGDVERVLIHDAARPFVHLEVFDRLIAALEDHDAAIPALPAVDTMARGRGMLDEIVSRDGLVRVQTPQAFRFGPIHRAHAAWCGEEATDDAQIARAAGMTVAIVEGDPALDKLTFEADFRRAEAALLGLRVGFGFDVHAFAAGAELWLGGIQIPHDKGLAGHSDADVVLHALTDAILGALGAGDIGDHFPPSDPKWRGAPSSQFLDHARALVDEAGGRIAHVDVTIVCEAPRIGPYRDAMRARIAELLRLAQSRISIKATTTERLGFTGRGEGIAAQAVATVALPEVP
ncbi:MAG TPA: bifunctional 2-C-methyl-D-erythritol 4-phosphate cytidylyltransferase/2-C-methyl-D-erythritol 2,4-cyclodiphosphate synthase [Allosphingosinicella sp.]|nr:bifunctional 2-C-methyl-D-erythritol 4-phosphate cytidylyltransferase/2-C-methyl-D-erythritol 2,4-cyclodiphosphate synthase [Allosphingosinicella sp.]